MSRWGRDYGGWYPERRKRKAAPEHGIKVKKIGATWWGKLWVEALERMSSEYSNRLARGGTYARTGRVHDLVVSGGCVKAKVTGTRLYRVTLTIAPLPDAAWCATIAAMSAQAVFAAKLLAGEMPQQIDEAFAAAGVTLFPAPDDDLETECSCPDYANPCKHVAAVHYVLGEAFDGDPFLLFELRGRTKDRVLADLRRARARAKGAEDAAGESTPSVRRVEGVPASPCTSADFERARGDLSVLRFHLEAPALHATLVRALGAPPRWSIDVSLADLLAPACEAASALARRAMEPSDAERTEP